MLGPVVRLLRCSSAQSFKRQLLLAAYGTKASTNSSQPSGAHACPSSRGFDLHGANSASQHTVPGTGVAGTEDGGEGWEERRQSGARASSSSSNSSRRGGSNSSTNVESQQDLKHLADMTQPAKWFPSARAMKRTIIAHLGPTNSGKTHAALSALKGARSGVYCGPLRLLACEVADRLNAEGVACHLVTGQEVRSIKGARHTACTVEMAQLDHGVDVAVIDEVQMLADPGRGWSWSHALLGLPARELHVCGDGCALPLLERMAAECGDELQVKRYRRLSPLVVMGEALGGVRQLQEGDCVVAFSRRALHRLRREVEAKRKHAACMVYGALPPDVRRRQAALFNTDSNAYGVLVASDAIGQGLNLSIRRIIFQAMSKFDGNQMRPLTAAEVKQIAGRAGRYGISTGDGYVTTMSPDDLPHLQTAMATPSQELPAACLMPRFEQLALFTLAHMAAAGAPGAAEGAEAAAHAEAAGTAGNAACAAGAGCAASALASHHSSSASGSGGVDGYAQTAAHEVRRKARGAGSAHQVRVGTPLFGSFNASSAAGTAPTAAAGCDAPAPDAWALSSGSSSSSSSSCGGVIAAAWRANHGDLRDSSIADTHTSSSRSTGGSMHHFYSSSAGTRATDPNTSSASSTSRNDNSNSRRHHMRATGNSFAAALRAFCTQAALPPSYFLADASNMALLAERLGGVALPFEDLHTFCTSPTDTGSPGQLAALALFAARYADVGTLNPGAVDEVVSHALTALVRVPTSDIELKRVEELWHLYSLYVWLGARFGAGVFQGLGEAQRKRDRCAELIDQGLSRGAAEAPAPKAARVVATVADEARAGTGQQTQQQQQRQMQQQQQMQQWQAQRQTRAQKKAARAERKAARRASRRWCLEAEASGGDDAREAVHVAW